MVSPISRVNYEAICVQIGNLDIGYCDAVMVTEVDERIVPPVRALNGRLSLTVLCLSQQCQELIDVRNRSKMIKLNLVRSREIRHDTGADTRLEHERIIGRAADRNRN